MKMRNFLTLVFLVSCCSIVRCIEEGSFCYYDDEMFCLKDGSGYVEWLCKDMKTNDNVWIKGKTTMCEKGYKCNCWQTDWVTPECECYNPRKPPNFASTGVIRWSGTFNYDNNWYVNRENPRTVNTPGEIHKDANGRFLYKWTEIGSWPEGKALADTKVQFEILIPNGNKTYLRYTGVDDGNKLCSKDVVKYEGDLTSIWKKHTRNGKGFRPDSSTQKAGSKNVHIETWSLRDQMQDGMDDWRWTVEYNSVKDYAIPLQYYYRQEDGFGGELRITILNYTYEPLNKDDESFQLENYCKV